MAEGGWDEEDVTAQLAARVGPAIEPLGFELRTVGPGNVAYRSANAWLTVRYVPRDGDLDVRLAPDDGGSIDLKLYLAASFPVLTPRLLRAIESAHQALELAEDVAHVLPAVADLLAGDPERLRVARSLRWWAVPRAEPDDA